MDRNIVLITIDSLRADHCGFLGYERDTTPTLDQMARKGIFFENAIAPGPNTFESMPVIFTGSFPSAVKTTSCSEFKARRTRIYRHMRARDTIAERFSRVGYSTAGFTPNPFTSRQFGFSSGFDHFQDFIEKSESRFRPSFGNNFLVNVLYYGLRKEREFRQWETFYDQIISWVDDIDEPYFLWILLMDAHNPFFVPSTHRTYSNQLWEFIANWRRLWQDTPAERLLDLHNALVSLYDDAVRYTDAFVNQLESDLEDSDPAFIIHSDHGEAFNEHGAYGHLQPHHLYEENIHVPLVIYNADVNGSLSRPFSLRELPQIIQTAATTSRNDPSAMAEADGIVVSRTLTGGRTAVRLDHWKFINHQREGCRLYNLTADPNEKRDLSGELNEMTMLMEQLGRQRGSYSDEEKQRIWRSITDIVSD